jgi:hypothetical protein
MSYDYLDQVIVATALIQPSDSDSFYNPTTNAHYGYAYDGNFYLNGVLQVGHSPASWATESPGAYRGDGIKFPTAGLILLSPVALTILDQSTPTLIAANLPLWMQFILSDTFMFGNNFDGTLNGWTPSGLAYADGVISVIYTPDTGNQPPITSPPTSPPITSPPIADTAMVVTIDFVQDLAYLDVAL